MKLNSQLAFYDQWKSSIKKFFHVKRERERAFVPVQAGGKEFVCVKGRERECASKNKSAWRALQKMREIERVRERREKTDKKGT